MIYSSYKLSQFSFCFLDSSFFTQYNFPPLLNEFHHLLIHTYFTKNRFIHNISSFYKKTFNFESYNIPTIIITPTIIVPTITIRCTPSPIIADAEDAPRF